MKPKDFVKMRFEPVNREKRILFKNKTSTYHGNNLLFTKYESLVYLR